MERYAPYAGGTMIEDPNGPLVKYDDAVRAVAEAEQRGRDGVAAIATEALRKWYEQGQRDERARIRAAVEALLLNAYRLIGNGDFHERVIAAIDAGGES